MPLNISIHSVPGLRNGAMSLHPIIDPNTAAQVVALGAQSTAITGPALLALIADEGQRISVSAANGYVAPAATGIKLVANGQRFLELPKGTWYVNVVAG